MLSCCHTGMQPKRIAEKLALDHELVTKTCARMAKDGQVSVEHGAYYVSPLSPEGHEGHEGQGNLP
jgi:Mn-dependent DtxR family transcriptional regulator